MFNLLGAGLETGGGSLTGGNASAESKAGGAWIQNKGMTTAQTIVMAGSIATALLAVITLAGKVKGK